MEQACRSENNGDSSSSSTNDDWSTTTMPQQIVTETKDSLPKQPLHHQEDATASQQQPKNHLDNDTPIDRNCASALVISASDKAGMEGIDRARIDAIILRESENSLYMKNERRRDEKVNEKIQQMRDKLRQQHEQAATSQQQNNWRRQIESQLEPEIDALLSGRNTRSTCVVVDMDMFFMACELLTRPDLRDKPCCVGGNMISTSNYKARKYGVRSAMAGWIGDKLVEELSGGTEKLIHVPSNFQLYREKSHIVQGVLREYDPHCRCMSLDEAFLDLGPYLALKLSKGSWSHDQIKDSLAATQVDDKQQQDNHSNTALPPANPAEDLQLDVETTLQNFSSRVCLNAASEVISDMRRKVCEATGGLTCSAGLAPNFVVAKIASDCNKPNGQKIVGPELEESVLPFLRPMPTRKVPGIGRVTQKMLQAFNITTVQHLYDERALVRFLFHSATAKSLLRAAMGGFGQSTTSVDDEDEKASTTQSSVKRKGISHERTFTPGESWQELNCRLEDIARMLAKDMKEEGIWARTISLKIKLHTFDVLQRSRSMGRGVYLQHGDDLLQHAAEMLRELRREHKGNSFALRLMGIRCSNLVDDAEKASMTANQHIMENFLAKGSSSTVSPKKITAASSEANNVANAFVTNLPKPSDSSKEADAFQSYFQQGSTGCSSSANIQATTTGESSTPPPTQDNPKRPGAPLSSQVDTSCNSNKENTTAQKASCPICTKELEAESSEALNRVLNHHIDSCLNGPTVRQAIQEETQRAGIPKRLSADGANLAGSVPKAHKKQRLTEYFTS